MNKDKKKERIINQTNDLIDDQKSDELSYLDEHFCHKPILLDEIIDLMNICTTGIYVDCTTGGAGHSSAILKRLIKGGTLVCFDQDLDALAVARKRLAAVSSEAMVHFVHSNFTNLISKLRELNIHKIDGMLADLGVSSFQLDEAQRGFSYQQKGPLDMRMNKEAKKTAKTIINEYEKDELAFIFKTYGEEKYADLIAKAICINRQNRPYETTDQLVDTIVHVIPAKARREKQHPAKRVFQAIRIAVNEELKVLEQLLQDGIDVLDIGGRMNIITFHSLEDRIVKQTFKAWQNPCTCPPQLPCVCNKRPLGTIIGTKKGFLPTAKELQENKRARSARLRVFEKG